MQKASNSNEIDMIIAKIVSNPIQSNVQALCQYMSKNRSYCEETIKKLGDFFSTNYSISVDLFKKIIIPVLKLLKETSQLISFLNFIMPNLMKPLFFSTRSIEDINQITKIIALLIEKGEVYTWQLMETSIYDIFYYFSNEKSFKYPNIKYAMLSLLTEFIENAPLIAYAKIIEERLPNLIQIVQNFKDENEDIRRIVGVFIEKCVRLIISKGQGRNSQIMDLFKPVEALMKFQYDLLKEKDIIGILSALKALSISKEFFLSKKTEIIAYIFLLKDNKSEGVRVEFIDSIAYFAELMMLAPEKSQFDQYCDSFLSFIKALLESKASKKIKASIYLSFGKLSRISSRGVFEKYLYQLLKLIKEQIDNEITIEHNEVFKCIADLMCNYRLEVLNKIDYRLLLEKIFINGFYQSQIDLIDQLLSSDFDEYNKLLIIKVVLNVISLIICKRKFSIRYYYKREIEDDAEKKRAKDFLNKNRKAINTFISKEPNQTDLIANALSYLKKISNEFFNRDILSFYQTHCLMFLSSTNNNWDMSIKLKCIELSKAEWTNHIDDQISVFFISSILDSYLNVVLNDPNNELRLEMISAIDERYDIYLSKEPFFNKLISLISFRDTLIQEKVIQIISRLADKSTQMNNPAILFIKQQIINRLVLIEELKSSIEKEEQITLLYHYVHFAKHHFAHSIAVIFATLQKILQREPELDEIIMKVICELIPFIDESIDLEDCLNRCISNLKEGIHLSRLEISLKTINEIIRKKKISLYHSSKAHLELVSVLLKMMTRDENKKTMKIAMKIMGYIGAMNPEQLESLFTKNKIDINDSDKKRFEVTSSDQSITGAFDADQCTQQVVLFFMRILKENTNQELSNQIISNLSSLFKALQPNDSPLIDIILPTVLEVLPKLEELYAKGLMDSLLIILGNFKAKFNNFLGDMLELLMRFIVRVNYQDIVFKIFNEILREFDIECYFSLCIPLFMNLLKTETKSIAKASNSNESETKAQSEILFIQKHLNISVEIYKCFSLMANKLSTYLNIIIPQTLVLFQQSANQDVCKAIFTFIGKITLLDNFIFYLPGVIHSLISKIETERLFIKDSLEIFIQMNKTIRNSFVIYLPIIISTFRSIGLLQVHFESFHQMLCDSNENELYLRALAHPRDIDGFNNCANPKNSFNSGNDLNVSTTSFCTTSGLKSRKAQIKKEQIMSTFDISHCLTEEDWREWLKATSKILFEQSPSFALFCCHQVADYYSPLILELYNYAFISGWRNLNDHDKMKVSMYLNTALESETTPSDILLIILNLTEFMGREENVLEFLEVSKLGIVSLKCKAYAKALYYKECEIKNKIEDKTLETLISLYHVLRLPESVSGILKYAQTNNRLQIDEDNWNIKLHKWKKGLVSVNKKLIASPNNQEFIKDKLLCLEGLFDWEGILETQLPTQFNSINDSVDDLYTKASLHLSKWDEFKKYSSVRRNSKDDYENNFFSAVNSILCIDYQKAATEIKKARHSLETKLKSLLSESYTRGYEFLFKNEVLVHLEEIIQLKQQVISKESLIEIWDRRLSLIEKNPHNYERMLAVRSIVLPMESDYENYLNLAKICRKQNRFETCYKILNRIKSKLTINAKKEISVKIDLNIHKCLFEEGKRSEAIAKAKELVVQEDIALMPDMLKSKVYGAYAIYALSAVKVKSISEENINRIFNYLTLSTKYNVKNHLSWHTYALQNYNYYDYLSSTSNREGNMQYAVNAIKGLTHSISIGGKNISKTLQDLLRLVDIWFRTGSDKNVSELITQCFEVISIDSFLLIIPQLLARLNISNKKIFDCLNSLLVRIGKHSPRALIYPLIVMKKARSKKRRFAAESILSEMTTDHSGLIKECELFVDELNRCAMLLHEEWSDAIEEAAKLFFYSNEIKGMINILFHVHEKMKRPPETMNEVHFYQLYSSELKEAESLILSYLETGNEIEMRQAWDIYYSTLLSLQENYAKFKRIELPNVSPELDKFSNSQVSVPGLYINEDKLIRIARIDKEMNILATKQHPRKIIIYGTDEKEYMFLLKGHEDLRQDERAMQLFNLVNTLLANARETADKNLFIKCFAVIPLSHNTGIIEWVPMCDTLHQLIKEYRTANKIMHYSETKYMSSFFEKFDTSSFLNKLEIFKGALQNTSGLEIYKILWHKSKNSEVWLERRTNYSRSLAVMSIVGYILGLGDRHPSNIMLDRRTGKIIHIDFGDCFEVAMKRDKFPERVPFRLTRMLIKALEVSGIEGTFRITCENVMRILRSNKDSLLAILTSFLHDPLISFRIMIPMIMKRNRHKKKVENSKAGKISRLSPDNRLLNEEKDAIEIAHNEADEGYERKAMETAEKQILTLFEERDEVESEELNQIAKIVLDRINDKLQGTDFQKEVQLDVEEQINRLIIQATSNENLAQSYLGWCPYW